jgi:hypothetical protein
MKEIPPLIGSNVSGPLGILHLPRLWLKILLHAAGRLPEGYRHGSGGFDSLLCERLGIDEAAFVAYVETEKPDYLTLERWVVAHARDLSPATITALNQRIRTANMSEANAAARRAQFGIADESFANACVLNDLDDWAGFHAHLTAEAVV